MTVLTVTDDGVTVEAVDATVESVETVDLTALPRLSSCQELSKTVDTCCQAVEPGLRLPLLRDALGFARGVR